METKERPQNPESQANSQPDLRFGNGLVAVAGAFSGVAIAVGGTATLLALGQSLGPAVLTTLVVLCLAGGSVVCLVSAFFGLVMPRHLRGGPWMDPDKWRRFAEERRRWHHEHGPWRQGSDWDRDDDARARGGARREGGDEEGPRRRPRAR